MKTAEEWFEQIDLYPEPIETDLVGLIKQIQLDAYKAGMTEAAKEIRKLPIQFCRDLCESAILSARDRKSSL